MQKLLFYLILTFSFLLQGASAWDRYNEEQNKCPLEKAVINRDLNTVVKLIASGTYLGDKNSLISIAIRNNDVAILERLIHYNNLPLNSEFIFHCSEEVLKAKTIKAIKDYKQFFEFMESLKWLSISIYYYDADRLLEAIYAQDIKLVNEVLEDKVHPDIDINPLVLTERKGYSVLHIAIEHYSPKIAESIEIIKALINAKADVNMQANHPEVYMETNGYTPLHLQ